jgi:hypothetical protein
MPTTAENFRHLLGAAATDRTIKLASSAIDVLTAAGASQEVISFVIDAIAIWDAQQFEQREPIVEELKNAVLRGSPQK